MSRLCHNRALNIHEQRALLAEILQGLQQKRLICWKAKCKLTSPLNKLFIPIWACKYAEAVTQRVKHLAYQRVPSHHSYVYCIILQFQGSHYTVGLSDQANNPEVLVRPEWFDWFSTQVHDCRMLRFGDNAPMQMCKVQSWTVRKRFLREEWMLFYGVQKQRTEMNRNVHVCTYSK